MSERHLPKASSKKRWLWPIVITGAVLAWIWYANWSAERDARLFCQVIVPGEDVSTVVAGFKREHGDGRVRHHPTESHPGHAFLFMGVGFDRAYCTVKADAKGKVVSTQAYMAGD